jgi:hypothetical protein
MEDDVVVVVAHHGQVQCWCFGCAFGAFCKKSDFWLPWKRWKKQRGVDTIAKY